MAKCEHRLQDDSYIITDIDGFYDIKLEPWPGALGWRITRPVDPPGTASMAGPHGGGLSKEEAVIDFFKHQPDSARLIAEVQDAIAACS